MNRNNVHTFERSNNLARWITNDVRVPRVNGGKLDTIIAKVKPIFAEWLKADHAWERNTLQVGMAIRIAWNAYAKESDAGRVGFARLFDDRIPEDAKTRDLADNTTYNRLNYLIDKIGKPKEESDPEEPRVTVSEKRAKMQADYLSFKRRFAKKPIAMSDVEKLIAGMLAEIWNEEAVKEVLAA